MISISALSMCIMRPPSLKNIKHEVPAVLVTALRCQVLWHLNAVGVDGACLDTRRWADFGRKSPQRFGLKDGSS